jgi:tetratricopeptide (TPR) repeat protein
MDTPEDDEALTALAQALLALENYPEAATTLLERVQIAPQRDRKIVLLLEVARLYTGPMADAAGGIPHYETIFGLAAAQPEAAADLMNLVLNPASSESAAALLIPQLEQAHRYNELAQVWDARSKLAENPGDAVEALRQLAKIRFERLGDIAGSLAANNLLMDRVGPDDLRPVLEASNKMSVRLDKAEEHVDALARRAGRADLDPQSRVMIAQSAADMAEGILGDRTRALHLLATLLEAGIADEPTCRNIERLARAAGDKQLLARVLAESAKLASGQPATPTRWSASATPASTSATSRAPPRPTPTRSTIARASPAPSPGSSACSTARRSRAWRSPASCSSRSTTPTTSPATSRA